MEVKIVTYTGMQEEENVSNKAVEKLLEKLRTVIRALAVVRRDECILVKGYVLCRKFVG